MASKKIDSKSEIFKRGSRVGYTELQRGNAWFCYDGELLGEDCGSSLFDSEWLRAQGCGCLPERGKALMFESHGLEMVLKCYRRGGMVGRFVEKSYLFGRLENTRMWREFQLLREMRAMGLPVPRPVAARCVRNSPLAYSGELITEKVADSKTLAETLCEAPLDDETWTRLGKLISRFHQRNVHHADLNANNILLTSSGRIYLIDFDKGAICPRLCGRSAAATVRRLRRSLLKLQDQLPVFHFSMHDWQSLENGYAKDRTRWDLRSVAVS